MIDNEEKNEHLNSSMLSVIIPIYNAAENIESNFSILKKSPIVNEIIVIDTGSTDDSIKIAESYGALIIEIEKHSFDHGKSRTLGGKKASGDILVYMTQDAVPVNKHSIENLVKPLLENKEIGASYGRQLPHHDATPFAAHLRAFNYPPKSSIKSLKDREPLGIKTPFMSNSFAAYKKSAIEKVGYFREGVIMAEDTYAGTKLLMAGYKIAYVAEALVYHSHNYTALEEFKRYFDIGVFHRMESWILNEFGKAEGEGLQYLKSELSYFLRSRRVHLIPESILRIGLKYTGYKLGNNYERLPKWFIRKFSMHADFWNKRLQHEKET
ncbi:poly-beta-1,6-N-acetyl-D-glucosamine synthase [bacterium BMS3Bbin07]|nr:poly-beta-1,6-N-acetyl-D-glucosamine synthase [bacterium BMS3Bbin07]